MASETKLKAFIATCDEKLAEATTSLDELEAAQTTAVAALEIANADEVLGLPGVTRDEAQTRYDAARDQVVQINALISGLDTRRFQAVTELETVRAEKNAKALKGYGADADAALTAMEEAVDTLAVAVGAYHAAVVSARGAGGRTRGLEGMALASRLSLLIKKKLKSFVGMENWTGASFGKGDNLDKLKGKIAA